MVIEAISMNVERIKERIADAAIKSGRRPEEVKIVAATKTRTLDEMIAVAKSGVYAIGENRVQEAMAKKNSWPEDVHIPWHFIGTLQRNKARKAIDIFDCIQSVNSSTLADTLQRITKEKDKKLECMVEVNISGEESKQGVDPGDVEALVEHVLSNCDRLKIIGLMGMAPLTEKETEIRRSFALLRTLRSKLEESLQIKLPELSMGMSDDFEYAIMEGSTMVRIGTALFGPRR